MSSAPRAEPGRDELVRLAELHGVQTSYRDVFERVQEASTDSLLAVLRALGVAVDRPEDAGDAARAHRRDWWSRMLPPVGAVFDPAAASVELRLPQAVAGARLRCQLELEEGQTHEWTENLAGRDWDAVEDVDGVGHVRLRLDLPHLPFGYHRLTVELGERRGASLVVVAPPRAYQPPRQASPEWGVFLPWYAVRTVRDWGAGDITDLLELGGWAGSLGATVVGTLPLLPVYLGGWPGVDREAQIPFDPSPYSPVSRLFWNELVVDLTSIPEVRRFPAARELLASQETTASIQALRSGRLADYQALAALKGRMLSMLARLFFEDPGQRYADLERFLRERPEAEDYALFRGAVARHGSAWWTWPAPVRDGRIGYDDVEVEQTRTHLYAQLVAREQVAALAARLQRAGQRLYLDLPIGARRDGYDVWRHRELFAMADAGAPPDMIFTAGQNWGFPPLHPERLREDGYRYLVAVLRHHLRLADLLRIDHVMGLHRLYWIPDGMEARDGVYVRYHADEWYAILNLESHRHLAQIVGENLGTVPPAVDEALLEHGISRMYVVEYEIDPDAKAVLGPVSPDVVASVDTHDMPPFAAWWQALDVDDTRELGLLDEEEAERRRDERASVREKLVTMLADEGLLDPAQGDDPVAVHAAILELLGASDAAVVLVNVEDLWAELEPQNTPGTSHERPNWRRRTTLALDAFRSRPEVVGPLRRLNAARTREV